MPDLKLEFDWKRVIAFCAEYRDLKQKPFRPFTNEAMNDLLDAAVDIQERLNQEASRRRIQREAAAQEPEYPNEPEYTKAIHQFAIKMVAQMAANDHKTGWKHASRGAMLSWLQRAVDDLSLAHNGRAESATIARRAADVGNFAMMIYYQEYRDEKERQES
jgi:hypothetical protein